MIQHSEINGGSEPEATAWRVYISHGYRSDYDKQTHVLFSHHPINHGI